MCQSLRIVRVGPRYVSYETKIISLTQLTQLFYIGKLSVLLIIYRYMFRLLYQSHHQAKAISKEKPYITSFNSNVVVRSHTLQQLYIYVFYILL
jgi:hypothetical protein